MDVFIALHELLLSALGFLWVVVECRLRSLVLTDGPGSWGSSRRFVAYMADPGMVSTRDPRCHRGTKELVQLTHYRRGGILQLTLATAPSLL
jgi:hypothetical protein